MGCIYCGSLVVENEWGACYTIDPDTEDLYWSHMECVEIYEGVILEPSWLF